MHDSARTANLLGTTALAVNDGALAAAVKKVGVSASGAAALVVLSASPGLGMTELGRRGGAFAVGGRADGGRAGR